jgi:hypothetical protein
MSEEKNVNQNQNPEELSEEQLGAVQGGNSISVPVTLEKTLTARIPKTGGGSIAQGDTLDNTLTQDGLPS